MVGSHNSQMRRRVQVVVVAAALSWACADGDAPLPGPADTAPGGRPNVVQLSNGAERVTLTTDYTVNATGQGWNLASHTVTESATGSDFSLLIVNLALLFPTAPQGESPKGGFCAMRPAALEGPFERLEDIPTDFESCAAWGPATLGGHPQTVENAFAGQGYLVKDHNGVVVSKLLTVSDSALGGGTVSLVFDIMNL